MTAETIGVTVTYKEPITFHLRMISIVEENALRQKMFGLTEDEKAEKSYQNNVDMLADLTAEHPDVLEEDAKGNKRSMPFEFQNSPSGAVKAFFAEKSILKERIAEYAVRGYFLKLVPDISFL